MKKNRPGLTGVGTCSNIDIELNLNGRVEGKANHKHASQYDFEDLRKLALGKYDRNQAIKDKLVQAWRNSKAGSYKRSAILKMISNFENKVIYNLSYKQKKLIRNEDSEFIKSLTSKKSL